MVESKSLKCTTSLFLSSKLRNMARKYGLTDIKIFLCPATIAPSSVFNLISQKTSLLKKRVNG